ncbi:NAD-dependent epimerase/dehydratase family protein [Brasilonema sp. UFV-L1]|uniref:NAD-dependent epimerase/dehydratase family protein n=1 Tax=Brasilonema sp. UFV-L1 TaxID=2234130 RepID=UPI00145C3F55|nr:NAD-dependent epimerase/dehydratase family protein [Brasilonema sp. UFV-L1]NMG09922.1 NAD-dependent dehydratase [Brasilonema sp. UFV-L1]
MKILIIGGTNFIGLHVVPHLCAIGHEVTLFHRGKTIAELPSNVHQILGDRTHLHEFKSKFKEISPEVVLDIISYTEHDALTLMNTFKGITQRVVAISSMDVYRAYDVILGRESEVVPVPLTEDSPVRQKFYPFEDMPNRPLNTPVNYEKILVEQVVMSDSDLPGTIVRLPMVYGPNDPRHRLYSYLQRMDDNRPAIVLEESLARWRGSYGYVENVAYAIALAVCDQRAKGRIYHVADTEVFTEAKRITRVGKVAGWQGEVISVSRDKLPAEWKLTVNTEQHWFVDSTRIRQELGYKEIVSLEKALQRTIDWERIHPPEEPEELAEPWLLDYGTEDGILAKLV